MKKIIKRLQFLYDYSYTLDRMPPRGDGAKDAVAVEIHQECKETLTLLGKILKNKPDKFVASTVALVDLVERMLLDKLGEGYTPEELEERGDV